MMVSKSSRTARSTNRRLLFETFEAKLPMAGDVGLLVQHHLDGQTLEAGQQDAVMSQLTAYTTGTKHAKLDALYFAAQPGTNFRGIEDFDLRADLVGRNGRPGTDGIYETVIARDVRPQANTVRFFTGLGINLRGVPLQVTADIRENAITPQKIGLRDAVGKMSAQVPLPWWFGGRVLHRPIPVHTVGADNPTHKIEQSDRLLTRELAGPSTDSAVENEKGIVLGRFSAAPSGTDPLLLTSVVYTASQGNVYNISQWQLWVDTDNSGSVDTIVQDNASTLGSTQVNFQNLLGGGYVVTTDTLFEVRGNVGSAFSSHNLQMGLAGLSVEKLDTGASVHWDIAHAPQTTWYFYESEALHVSPGTTPVPQRQVLGGTQSDTLAGFRAEARLGPVDIYYVGIDVEGQSRSIDRLEVFREGVLVGIASRAGALPGDDFGLHMQNRQLVIAEGIEENLDIRARVKRDSEGGVSGDEFAIAVDQVMARGNISSNDIDVIIDDIVSRPHTVVMSEFESFDNASSTPHGSSVPFGVVASGEYRVTTKTNTNFNAGTNRSLFEQLSFEYYAMGTVFDTSGFGLYNKADSTIVDRNYIVTTLDYIPIVSSTVTGNFRVIYSTVASSGIDATIDAGSSAVFVAQANILSVDLNASMQVGLSLNRGAIKWRDQDFAHSTLFDWVDLPYTTVWSTKHQS
jgi:hypothetical protein